MKTEQIHYATDRESLEKSVRIQFFRASGPGGQHRNKTQTGVRLFHRPSGISVEAKDSRSQDENREHAFERLQRRLQKLNARPKPRVPTRVSKGQKRRRLEEKRIRSTQKRQRKSPGPKED